MLVTVARITSPHGLRGWVRLEVRTDRPEERLSSGNRLLTEPASVGPLTIEAARLGPEGDYVRFAEVGDRTDAEALRDTWLLTETDAEPAEDEAWYRHELLDLRVQDSAGRHLGTVVDVEHLPAQDVLVIAEQSGQHTMVPFVRDIVPLIDVAAGRIVLEAPPGLLHDTSQAASRREEGG